jgi:hypothetical protein
MKTLIIVAALGMVAALATVSNAADAAKELRGGSSAGLQHKLLIDNPLARAARS